MSHYEQRLESDLDAIRDHMRALSTRAGDAVEKALHSLLSGNSKLAYATILGDGWINERTREIDGLCHRFIARHLPSAGHLRYTSAVIRTSLQLERIGDYAVTIAREGVQLSAPPDGAILRQLEIMAGQANGMLAQSIAAFNEGNEEKARTAMGMASAMEGTMDGIYADLVGTSDPGRIKDLVALFVVFNLIKRVADQAKNICEETLFAVTGEIKRARVHDVLFMDEDGAGLSQMATAIAGRSYPDAARYTAAGRSAADGVDPDLRAFLEQRGFDLSAATPSTLDTSPSALSKYFVIISLSGPVQDYAKQIPFHTSALEWDVGSLPQGLEGAALEQRLEELYREVSSHVRGLVETLSGEEVD